MADLLVCPSCHKLADELPFVYDQEAEYHKILAFLAALEHSCKTTLDYGIRIKDFLDKNKEKLSGYKTPF